MKILFKIISAVLYFNSVSPVLMYYIYDDNPNIGFVALDNGIGAYGKPGFSVNSKKQFTGAYNSKYQKINNENVVDSHFKIMKTPTRYAQPSNLDNARLRTYDISKNNKQRIVEDHKQTESPKPWQQRTQHLQVTNTANSDHPEQKQHTKPPTNPPVRGDYGYSPNQDVKSHVQASNNQQIPPIRPKAVNADYSSQMQQRSQRNKEDVFEPKPSFVQINVRKAQITDSQKIVRMNNNRQITSLAAHVTQDRQRMPSSMMKDKTLHKTNGVNHDHNVQVMTRVLDDITQKISDRRHKKGEYRKRDTKKNLDLFEKSKRSVMSENMRKYIGKDKSMIKEHRSNVDLARIGSHEESLEANDTPYALFYRMNPESLDQQEGFMLMGSMEDNTSSDFNSKEKRLSKAFEDEINLNKSQKSKKNGNMLKMRKKLKNFSNFRNL